MAEGKFTEPYVFLPLLMSTVLFNQLHMIENRVRIEKQVLLGRQAVHKAYKNKSRSTSQEPRQFLLQKSLADPIQNEHVPVSLSHSGSDRPLSVDTDAEAAFARSSPFFKRDRSSQELLSSHELGRARPPSARRRRLVSELSNPTVDDGPEEDAQLVSGGLSAPSQNSPSNTGLFSRLHTQSFSRLSLPFSYEYRRRNSIPDNKQGFSWSSESSSDDDSIR